jgi:hypothetical protein
MKSKRLLSIVFILALTSMACFSTGTQSTPSDVLFSDDFSNTDKNWDQVTETDRSTDYYNNAYRIVVDDTDSQAWANPGNESFTDVRVEVNATKNGDGYYGIMKATTDGGKPIGRDSLLQSDEINQGAATNQIRFDCVGSTLTLYINGSQVDQQTDTDYSTGNVGLLAGSFDTAGTDIIFDNFVVYKP